MKRWGKGVFQCSPGFFSDYPATLRKNVGRVYFAGDYTGDPDLTAAAWSGNRAARAIRDALPPVMSIEPGRLQAGRTVGVRSPADLSNDTLFIVWLSKEMVTVD